jgi:ubiquitin C-terminal hydrolase
LSEAELQSLADEIINKCLFTFEIKPIEGDITKSVDIVASEKNSLNKAQSSSSRKASFELLQTLCNNNPDLIPQIINLYFGPLLNNIKKPKKSGYSPRTETKSYGYCGLKNLGSICYMNSMIQQFFCVPTFRYSILSVAQKVIKDNIQVFEGENVNDNMMH